MHKHIVLKMFVMESISKPSVLYFWNRTDFIFSEELLCLWISPYSVKKKMLKAICGFLMTITERQEASFPSLISESDQGQSWQASRAWV